MNEMKEVVKVVGILRGKPFLTHRLAGTGPAYSMMAYVCTQLLIQTGTTSLERYRGVGSEYYTPQNPFNKNHVKKYIQDFMADPDRGGVRNARGKLINESRSNLKFITSLPGLSELMETEEAVNGGPRSGDDSESDDEHQASRPPSQKRHKSARTEDKSLKAAFLSGKSLLEIPSATGSVIAVPPELL